MKTIRIYNNSFFSKTGRQQCGTKPKRNDSDYYTADMRKAALSLSPSPRFLRRHLMEETKHTFVTASRALWVGLRHHCIEVAPGTADQDQRYYFTLIRLIVVLGKFVKIES
ncbi:hypothetical protein Nepgr_001332 [Nepenthes gracilis]|uniref:Uncharacterized protein n=1 Tax=Nepenthes gracilis TaxID=150966 RepID=A0AAD3RXH8_NEPGR|nr:hypothetical protein Nepgr_001332 [Nepenthes gracilis]